MAGFFSFLRSGTKFVLDGDPDAKRIAPVYGHWREHPKTGQWFPRGGQPSQFGTYYCMGCGKYADRSWLTEVPQAEAQDICRVFLDREDETRRRLGMPPTK